MKRILIVLFLAVASVFTICFATTEVLAEDVTEAGKIYFHYQLWDEDYSSCGLWTWATGTGGTANGVEKASVDDFGAVMEITVMSDASDKIGIIPIRKDITLDTRWNYRETPDGYQIDFDVTALKNGTKDEIHLYYFQGGYHAVHEIDPNQANVLVAYYEPTGTYAENLGLHAWGWSNTGTVAWGTPWDGFQDGLKSPGNIQGKTALLQADPSTEGFDPGLIVYAGDDASKKTGDVKGFTDLQVGEVRVVYITGGNVYVNPDNDGNSALQQFYDAAFQFAFTEFLKSDLSGTYAKTPTVIFAKFSLGIATSTKRTETVVEQDENGWKLPDSVPEFPAYTPTTLPEGMKGRVVYHFQKWDGDYTGSGLWLWDTGTNGSVNGVGISGVDDFGAVIEVNVAADAAATIGTIPVSKNITVTEGTDPWYNFKASPSNIMVDVSKILDGTTTEIHVYFFEGGSQVFVVDPTEKNVFVVYHEQNGVYDENIGLYSWAFHETVDGPWGTLYHGFQDGAKSPAGIQSKVALMTTDPTSDGGMILCKGADGTTKVFDGDIKGGEGAGVFVRYVTLGNLYTERTAYAPVAFSGKIVTRTIIDPKDILSFFTLKQGETVIPIKSVSYDATADTTALFVLQLDEANKLDNTKDYVLSFADDGEGDLQLVDDIALNVDKEAPVITLIDTEYDKLVDGVIELPLGSLWNPNDFPQYRATDDRDGDLQTYVYVSETEGTLDTHKADKFPITLLVEDEWGNVGSYTFEFRVLSEQSGCNASAGAIAILSMIGISFFFLRRRQA